MRTLGLIRPGTQALLVVGMAAVPVGILSGQLR